MAKSPKSQPAHRDRKKGVPRDAHEAEHKALEGVMERPRRVTARPAASLTCRGGCRVGRGRCGGRRSGWWTRTCDLPMLTEDEKCCSRPATTWSIHAQRSVARMPSRGVVEGFDALAQITKGGHRVRLGAHRPGRSAIRRGAGNLPPAREGGILHHHRGWPGIMAAANRGAKDGGGTPVAATSSCRSSRVPTRKSIRSSNFRYFSCGRPFIKYSTHHHLPGGYGTRTSCSRRSH